MFMYNVKNKTKPQESNLVMTWDRKSKSFTILKRTDKFYFIKLTALYTAEEIFIAHISSKELIFMLQKNFLCSQHEKDKIQ